MNYKSLILLALLGLTACVTTNEEGAVVSGYDKSKAIEASLNAANQYLRAKDAENALRHLRKADAIDSSDPRVSAGMAYAFELTHDFALADERHRKAIKGGGEGITRARNNYATFLFKQGRYEESKAQLTLVVNDVLYGNRSAAFTTLGFLELRLNNTDDAEYAFTRAVSIDRRNATASLELASLMLKKNDINRASLYYSTYQYLGRTTPRGLYIGIKLAEAQGDKSKAASNALALKNMFPQSSQYAQYLREKK